MILKIIGLGFLMGKNAYLKNPWNVMDFIIVTSAMSKYPIMWYTGNSDTKGSSIDSLRSLRVLRPLKTIAKSKDLRVILNAIFSSIPMLINIVLVLVFFILVMAIMGS